MIDSIEIAKDLPKQISLELNISQHTDNEFLKFIRDNIDYVETEESVIVDATNVINLLVEDTSPYKKMIDRICSDQYIDDLQKYRIENSDESKICFDLTNYDVLAFVTFYYIIMLQNVEFIEYHVIDNEAETRYPIEVDICDNGRIIPIDACNFEKKIIAMPNPQIPKCMLNLRHVFEQCDIDEINKDLIKYDVISNDYLSRSTFIDTNLGTFEIILKEIKINIKEDISFISNILENGICGIPVNKNTNLMIVTDYNDF